MNATRWLGLILILLGALAVNPARAEDYAKHFAAPPDSARPWVYWYFMDGNRTAEGLTADLEAMKVAGIGGVVFLEVDLNIPRGPVEFMSPKWRELFAHAVREADRLGIEFILGAGPGWCGTGGPWVTPDQSMQHLVASETPARGPGKFEAVLPQAPPRKPIFGEGTLTPELLKQWQEFYRDVAVLAFPTPQGAARIVDVDEKALVYRYPYSSSPGVRPRFVSPADYPTTEAAVCIAPDQVLDLTDKLDAQGKLTWDVPAGEWTIMRFGRTATGQATRPAPLPGLGFESDKFSRAAVDAHFASFVGSLLQTPGLPQRRPGRGLTTLHFDSWEMGAQNWTPAMREEFTKRRGYDPLPYLPAMIGRVIESEEVSERFLWDLRQTAQELVIENHALRLKELGREHDMQFSIEPYDLNPTADMALGGVADVPMCEFWSQGFGFSTEYSVFEAASIAHTRGRPVVAAEAFTAEEREAWQQYPGRMKPQGDWAFCAGINRFAFHRYQHQPELDKFPGMTMGPYGVHWEHTQTWWDMVPAYHKYLARCQYMLRQGNAVADVLYLTPEGAPCVFTPPASALDRPTPDALPDRRGYNFDGIAPDDLIENAKVNGGMITFPHGMHYRLLVLPRVETMTPRLLKKIKELADDGATILGAPPRKSPSLADLHKGDAEVARLANEIWSDKTAPSKNEGRVILDEDAKAAAQDPAQIYPEYDRTAAILHGAGIVPDFESDASIRFIHRVHPMGFNFYFIANREDQPVDALCKFRINGVQPEWWDPQTGETRPLPAFTFEGDQTYVPIRLAPFGSGFVVFRGAPAPSGGTNDFDLNFPALKPVLTLDQPWSVAFDPKRGGPEQIAFETLQDWSQRPEDGIKHYSGKAVYRTTFAAPGFGERPNGRKIALELGEVKNLASVKLNGRDLGAVWCAPWQVEIPEDLLKEQDNELEITVANLWINRLIGDAALPEDQRIAQTTWNPYKADSPLQPSGLLGPVRLLSNR